MGGKTPYTTREPEEIGERGAVREFEIAILFLVVAGLWISKASAGIAHSRRRRWARWSVAGLLVLALAAHLAWEGSHWQMAPAYLAALIALLVLLGRGFTGGWRLAGVAAVLLLAAASCGLSYVFPMFALPAPTGSYAIGTEIVSMVDASRKEDAIPGDQHPREVVVQIWYPAMASHGKRAPYRRGSETSLASSYMSVDWTHARYDAPAAVVEGGFPILLYNPGWNGRRTQNTALTEELASHGYVVVTIDHPYNSGPAALSDGRVIRPLPAPELFDDVTPAAAVYALIDKEVAKETSDTLFVLQQVKRMNEDAASPLYHHLDMSKIGALGYSLGGAVAAEAALQDPEIHAVADLDTPLSGEAGKRGIEQPFLLLCEELTHTAPEQLRSMSFGQRRDTEMDEGDYARQLPLLRTPGSYQIELHGTLHTSFQDVIFTSPLQRFSGAGGIAPKRMTIILRRYLLAFFDQSLRGVPSPLLAQESSPFPEAKVLFRSPGGSAGKGNP